MSNFFLYAISVLIWGSTWVTINYQLGEVAPAVSLVYRYGLAAALLFAGCALARRSLAFGWRAHLRFAQMGLLLFSLNYLAAYYAQLYISSALNAIAFASMVWLNILNTRLFFGTRVEAPVYLGAALGMAGIVTLFWPALSGFEVGDGFLLGASLSLGGAFVASLGNMVSQQAQREALPVIQSNAWGMLYGGLLAGLFALGTDAPFNFDSSPAYVISLLYLAVFGSVIAFGAYLTLLGRIGAHRAGYVVVMFPVVALVLAAVFEGLVIDARMIVGAALALGGNVLILARRAGKGDSTDAPRRVAELTR